MRNYIHRSRFRASAASAILSLLPMLVLVISTVVMVRPTLAENGAIQTAPPSQSGSEYWTKQRMRSAKPLTPTVPGTPQGGSAISGPSGPAGGAPGQGPQIQPNPGNRGGLPEFHVAIRAGNGKPNVPGSQRRRLSDRDNCILPLRN